MILLLLILAFIWLGYETNWLTVNLLVGREGYMQLPSGAWITETDYNYLVNIIKPAKKKRELQTPCWYCGNGHDRQHIELGLMSYDLCECKASIVVIPKRKAMKRTANQRLASEIGKRFAPYSQANISKMKALIK